MPLKDRISPRRLIRAGIIRLGHKEEKTRKRQDGSTYTVSYPVQDDHFVLTDAPEIAQAYGEEPRELDVILAFPDVERNFDANYTVWAGGVLVCQGDGEQVTYATPHRVEVKVKGEKETISVYNAPGDTLVSNGLARIEFDWNGEHFAPGDHVPCPGAAKDLYPHCKACRLSAILKVMMAKPELLRLAYYQVATGSGRNYDTIRATLDLIYEEYGRVSGICYILRLVEQAATYLDADGVRKKTTKWFLQLEPYPQDLIALLAKKRSEFMAIPAKVTDTGEIEAAGEFIDEAEEQAPPPFAEDGGPAEPSTQDDEDEGETAEVGDEVPTRPQSLLAWINLHREDAYDNLPHLLNAIKAELGKDWKWPADKDTKGWGAAKKAAMEHKHGSKKETNG